MEMPKLPHGAWERGTAPMEDSRAEGEQVEAGEGSLGHPKW